MAQLQAMNGAIASTGAAGATAAGGLGLMNIALLGIAAAAVAVIAAVVAIGAGFLALGVIGLNISRSVETAMAGVLKTTSGLTDEFGQMNEAGAAVLQQFRELALITPLPLEDLLRIGELAGQLGIAEEALAGFTAVAAALQVSTDLTVEEATLGLARLSGIFEITATDMVRNTEQLGSAIAFLGNNFRATEPEILNFAKRVAAIGRPLGFTQADILGIGAAIASAGVESQLGGTAIQNTMIAIQKAIAEGGDELDVFAEVSGKTVEEFAKAWESDAAGTFTDFIEGLGDAGAEAFGILDEVGLSSDRTVRALLPLSATGEELRRAINGANGAFFRNTALTREAAIRYGTFDSQLEIFKNRLRDVGLTIGDIVKPAMADLLEAAGPLIDAIGEGLVPAFQSVFDAIKDSLLPAVEDLLLAFGFDITNAELTQGIANFGETVADGIEAFAGFLEDITELKKIFDEGGLVKVLEELGLEEGDAELFLDIAAGVAAFAFALALLPPIFALLEGSAIVGFLLKIGGGIAALNFPLLIIAGLIGLIVFLFSRFGEEIKEGALILLELTQELPKILGDISKRIRDALVRELKILLQKLLDFFGIDEEMKKRWGELWEDLKAIAKTILEKTIEFLLLKWEEMKQNMADQKDALVDTFGDIWEGVKEKISEKAGEILFNLQQDLIAWIAEIEDSRDDWVEAGKNILQGLIDGLKEKAKEAIQFVTDLVEDLLGRINDALGNRSPSTVFKEVGENMMRGLALGIIENMSMPQVALDALGDNIINAGQGIVSGAAAAGETSIDRSFNVGGMTINARPQAPNRIVDDLALLTQLA